MSIFYNDSIELSTDTMWNMINTDRTPKGLYTWLITNMSYPGCIYQWELQKPKDTFINKCGNCHDQALLMYKMLKHIGVDVYDMLSIEFSGDSIDPTDSHTIIYYKDISGMIYWLETTWVYYIGINGPYNNVSDLKDDVAKKFCRVGEFDGILFGEHNENVSYPYGEKVAEYNNVWGIIDERIYPIDRYLYD